MLNPQPGNASYLGYCSKLVTPWQGYIAMKKIVPAKAVISSESIQAVWCSVWRSNYRIYHCRRPLLAAYLVVALGASESAGEAQAGSTTPGAECRRGPADVPGARPTPAGGDRHRLGARPAGAERAIEGHYAEGI